MEKELDALVAEIDRVREEMEHAKGGKHPVRSREQAIAIGLSKARRAGVKVPKRGARAAGAGAKKKAGSSKGRAARTTRKR